MRRHDLTKKKTKTMTNTETKTMTKTNTFREHLQRAILETCEIWDTDYNFDNWEPEFMTICVIWQLRVTLDSIRNSCDVSIRITLDDKSSLRPPQDVDSSKVLGSEHSDAIWLTEHLNSWNLERKIRLSRFLLDADHDDTSHPIWFQHHSNIACHM